MPAPKRARRIVLKFGSGILTRKNSPGLDPLQFARLSAEIAALMAAGHQCVAVTSGAVAAGMSALFFGRTPDRSRDRAGERGDRPVEIDARLRDGLCAL